MRISEIYYRPGIVQGEGALLGVPMPFVRVAGCNLSCSWCDSAYTWKPGYAYTEMSPEQVLDTLKGYFDEHPKLDWVSITGGEPTIYAGDVTQICDWLAPRHVIIETNGLRHIPAMESSSVFVSCSPKLPGSGQDSPRTREKVRRFVEARAAFPADRTQYKFVISNQADLDALYDYCVSVRIPIWRNELYIPRSPVYVQPDGYIQPIDKYLEALKWLQENAPASVRVTPQVHRLVHGPDARGV